MGIKGLSYQNLNQADEHLTRELPDEGAEFQSQKSGERLRGSDRTALCYVVDVERVGAQ